MRIFYVVYTDLLVVQACLPGINPKTQTVTHHKLAPSRLNVGSFLAIQKMKIPQTDLLILTTV